MHTDRKRSYGTGSVFTYRDAWYGQWRIGGKQVKRKLGVKRAPGSREGLTKPQAEARLRRLIEEVRHAPVDERLTVREAGDRYLHHVEVVMRRKAGTLDDYRAMVRHLERHFGQKGIDRISADDVAAYMRAKQGEGLAPKTVSNHVAFAHGLFGFAVKRGWTRTNPVAGVDRPRPDGADPDIRYLDQPELEAVLRAVPDDALGAMEGVVYLAAAMTGARQGELLALRWRDVDWPAGLVRVRRNYTRGRWGTPKSRRSSRAVPMADRLAGELDRHFQRSAFQGEEDLVFAHPVLGTVLDASKLRKRFGEAAARAGVRPVRFHDLRHTFGTRMAAAGAPLRAIQEWMGHRDYKTTLIYADYAPDPSQGATLAERAFGAGTNSGTNLSTTEGKTELHKPL